MWHSQCSCDRPAVRIGDDDGVVDGVAVARQSGNVPRLDLDRFAKSLGQVKVVRARYFFVLCFVKTPVYAVLNEINWQAVMLPRRGRAEG